MRRRRLKKKHTPIDKSQLPYGIRRRIDDPEYLDSYRHLTCAASRNGVDLCGADAIPAHIRTGEAGKSCGTAQKPDDDLTEALCDHCHRDQEKHIGADWWLENVYKPQRRRAYRRWKCLIA